MSARLCICDPGECWGGPFLDHGALCRREHARAIRDASAEAFEALDVASVPSILADLPQDLLDRLNASHDRVADLLAPEALERLSHAAEGHAVGGADAPRTRAEAEAAYADALRRLNQESEDRPLGPEVLGSIVGEAEPGPLDLGPAVQHVTEFHRHTTDLLGEVRRRIQEGELADLPPSRIVHATTAGEPPESAVDLFRGLADRIISESEAEPGPGGIERRHLPASLWGLPVQEDPTLKPGEWGLETPEGERTLFGGRRSGRTAAIHEAIRRAAAEAAQPVIEFHSWAPPSDLVYVLAPDALPWLGVDPARKGDGSAIVLSVPRPRAIASRWNRYGDPSLPLRAVHPTPGYTRHTLGAREAARYRRRNSR